MLFSSRVLGSLLVLLLMTAIGGCASGRSSGGEPAGWTAYGESKPAMNTPVALASLKGGERDVVISGTITDVCKIKGCWMNVKDAAGTEMFVQFEDYGFFVPKNATAHTVKANGRAVSMAWSVEELRHFAEDAHKSPAEIAAINQPQTRVTFLADAVWIEGPGLDKPLGG